jgi:hypothetical protein
MRSKGNAEQLSGTALLMFSAVNLRKSWLPANNFVSNLRKSKTHTIGVLNA